MATANPKRLNTMLQAALRVPSAQDILRALDPSYLAPSSGRDAVFSPVGILHLYRQSFFEFATFLGVPVEHLWLAPGSTTELIEASTRRTLTERSFEQVAETILRSETAQTSEDELSSAIKAENTNDTKMGSSLKGGVNILIISAEASGDISNQQTQKKAREENHRQMRQQSAKASSEIRNNFKSTFRTVTEVTDTRSKRYVIANTSSQLVNYELRRKMRQVGVQTQDAGTQLCWQLYVDDAGKDLGVAELVHLASKADLAQYPTLPMMTEPKAIPTVVNINLVVPTPGKGTGLTASVAAGAIGFVAGGGVPGAVVGVGIKEIYDDLFGDGDDDTDAYGINTVNKIVQQYKVNMPNGYQMADAANQPIDDDDFKRNDDNPPVVPSLGDFPIRWSHKNGKNINWRAKIMNEAEGTFELVVDRGEATPKEIIEFQASIKLVPTTDAITNVKNMNAANLLKNKETDVAKLRAIKDEFIKTVKERVKLASAIKTRKVEDLREEERTVIYRNLVSLLMREAWSSAASRPMAHLRSELVKSIFDVDRMLYFVAPEWWQPRLHQSKQGVGSELPENELSRLNPASQAAIERAGKDSRFNARAGNAASKGLGTLDNMDTVSWGGAGRTDNYLITEDSEPAKLGASLGWLLQLDGDNLRNAFLNAPWVKAIVPIRPGKEREALEWLMQSQVEGADGLNEPYGGTEPKLQGLTVQQALFQLADEINAKYENGCVVQQEDVTELGDGQPPVKRNIFYLPSERVFERGFDPLKDGFRAEPDKAYEIIDQWIEIMPTDQIVAVDVKYDPKTGQQL
jgi:hypothetical protein